MLGQRNEFKHKKKQKRPNANVQVSVLFAHHDPNPSPDNVNRELFQLLGDLDPQMVPVEELQKGQNDEGKPKVIPKLARPVDKWVWHQFKNPAREDGIPMYHWMKSKETNDPYPFARFNTKPKIVKYSEEEYKKAVQPMKSDWDKLETDVLFELCERFNMRFIVIADRFADELQERINTLNCVTAIKIKNSTKGRRREVKAASKKVVKDRTVDELKDRYYSVSRELLTYRGDEDNPIVQKPFNFEMEVRRKNNLEKIFMRTKDQIEREKYCLSELKKIE